MTVQLEPAAAERLLAQAVENLERDYPIHWTQTIDGPGQLVPQREVHPMFAGSWDWHSCVHQTWLAVRLLRLRPALGGAGAAIAALDRLLTPESGRAEAAFFRGPHSASWERPYGWAWLFTLDAELRRWAAASPNGPAPRWSAALGPLHDVLRGRWLEWAGSAQRPIRAGAHQNSAFGLGLVLDAARAIGDDELAETTAAAARRWYGEDERYGGYEPDAADFLSPALVEADAMRRVLDPDGFGDWFTSFLPDLEAPRWSVLREPIDVPEPSDPGGSHLIGLLLSRAWCWRAIARSLPAGHRLASVAAAAADRHGEAGWAYVFGEGYAATHWVGTFAAYLDLGALSG
ncbi:MAG: DUF2891 domain-containing protein [Candidatus Dormiibacterota bacterium]